jgi:GT2 family glycosyltransferase
VIVVNSSPEQDTGRLVCDHFPETLFRQSPTRLLPHDARNRGVELARGELLVFTDPDCEAAPDWLSRLTQAYEEGSQALVGGMALGCATWWEEGVHLLKYHWLLSTLPAGRRKCAATANAAYGRELWNRIGPFPRSRYCGDGILSARAARAGQAPRFVPAAVVRHRHLVRSSDLWRQRFARGQDYARGQLEAMGKPVLSTWLKLAFSWTALPLVMVRSGRDAYRAGWASAYWRTLPIQAAGHAWWEAGETWAGLCALAGRLRRGRGS